MEGQGTRKKREEMSGEEQKTRLERIRELRRSLMDDPPRGEYPSDPRWQEIRDLIDQAEEGPAA